MAETLKEWWKRKKEREQQEHRWREEREPQERRRRHPDINRSDDYTPSPITMPTYAPPSYSTPDPVPSYDPSPASIDSGGWRR